MNRATVIKKLGNAIRAYKGTRHSINGPFVIQPQKTKVVQIRELLEKVTYSTNGCPRFSTKEEIDTAVRQIDGFKTYDDYNNWINKLRN